MSTLYKIELAALALGMLGGFFTLPSGQSLAGRLKRWWQEEHWLFCQAGGLYRERMALPSAVGVLFVLYFLKVATMAVSALSGLPEDWEFWDGLFFGMLTGFLVLKTLLATRYSGRQLAVLCLVLGYFYIINVVTGYKPLTHAAILMVVLKDVDLKKALRAVALFLFGDVAVTAALALGGLIPNSVQYWDNGRVRMDLGQGHANSLGILVAQALVLWLLTRFASLRWWDLLVAAAGIGFIYFVPNSRSSVIFAGLALAGMLAAKLLPRLFAMGWFQALCCLPAVGLSAIMWYFHYNYDKDVEWMLKLDKILTGRISLAYITSYEELKITDRPFRLFGQAFVTDRFYRVDSSYIYYAYLCGPLMAVLLCLGFAILTWKLMRTGRPELAVCVMVYACYAMMERCLSTINFSLLFMPAVLFGAGALVWPRAQKQAGPEERKGEA